MIEYNMFRDCAKSLGAEVLNVDCTSEVLKTLELIESMYVNI